MKSYAAARLWSTAVIFLPSLPSAPWDIFDPIGSLAKAVVNGYIAMFEWLSKFLANPPSYSDNGILPVLYSGSLNAAILLAYYAMVLGVIWGIARLKGETILRALGVFVVVSALSPLWIRMINAMAQFGNDLAALFHFYTATGATDAPPVDNPILGILLFMTNAMLALNLTALIVSYEVCIVLLKFTVPLAYSVSSVGKRANKLVKIVIAVGLVATMFGKAVAQLILDFTQLMIDTFPLGTTMVGAGIYSYIGLVLALLSQFMLIAASYTGVSAVEGRLSALIKGVTVTKITNTVKVSVSKLRGNHSGGMQPQQFTAGGRSPYIDPSTKKQQQREASRRKAAQTGVNVVAAGAGIFAKSPKVAMTVKGLGDAFFVKKPGS